MNLPEFSLPLFALMDRSFPLVSLKSAALMNRSLSYFLASSVTITVKLY